MFVFDAGFFASFYLLIFLLSPAFSLMSVQICCSLIPLLDTLRGLFHLYQLLPYSIIHFSLKLFYQYPTFKPAFSFYSPKFL